MANTLHPDPSFQKFNDARNKLADNFRFRAKSARFNLLFMGIIPIAGIYYAYSSAGEFTFSRRFRAEKVIPGEDYVPRDKDL